MSSNNDLKVMLASNDIDEIYDALIDIGKLDLRNFEPDVFKFLGSSEPDLQKAAIMVLGTYWKLPEFCETVKQLYESSNNDDIRVAALINWIGYFVNRKDSSVLCELFEIAQSADEDLFLKIEALRGIFRVSGTDLGESNFRSIESICTYSDFESLVDWDYVRQMVEKRAANR